MIGIAGESSITPENLSLVSLTAFQGMGETILNTPEDCEKAPTQEKKVGSYFGGPMES